MVAVVDLLCVLISLLLRTWKEGKFIIFDDSFEHEVWHDGDTFRLVLIIDFWHPEVTNQQKESILQADIDKAMRRRSFFP